MRQTQTGLLPAVIAALLTLTACGGGGGSDTPPANTAPVANAGAPQTVNAGAAVTLNGAASSDADGSITAYAWTQTAGPTVALSSASSSQPGFVAPQVATSSALTFRLVVTDNRGATSAAATVTITVNALATGSATIAGLVRFMRVPFRSTAPITLDYANAALQPSRGVIVRALNATTQAVLATGVTDASGGYSLSVSSNTSITIQVVARMQRDNTQPLPRWDVRVQDGALTSVAPYTFTSAAFNSNVGTQNIDIPSGIAFNGIASGVRASGPFAILDTIYMAMQAVLGVAPGTSFPPLVVDWGSQTAGTHFSITAGGVQHINLLADLTEDTDEFDQSVVAHEFGHYLEHNFSRADNIGGPHGLGDQLDMRVAFGEGFGHAFAAITLNDPVMRDSYIDSGTLRTFSFNIESNPPVPAGGGAGCWCSETSVASILWDAYDAAPDGSDAVAVGFAPIWEVLTTTQRTTPAWTSIFPFITSLKAVQPASAGLINTLVAAQNINAAGIDAFATAETSSPLPNMLPLFASISVGGAPVVLRSTDDAGHYNRLGNHRFLRFTPATTGTITVTLSTSNPNTGDPDFEVSRSGTLVSVGDDPPTEQPETETFGVTGGTTYIIDAYDCANGCSDDQGTPGDYDLTVTIN